MFQTRLDFGTFLFEGNAGEWGWGTTERQYELHMGFLERVDTVLN